jgi:sorbin and SH3 domain-containing protein 1
MMATGANLRRKTAEQVARRQETALYRHTIANFPLVYGPIPYKSPRKYVENEVTIHYKTPVRQEIKEYLSEDELAYRQAEAMKKIYQEERRRKYLQVSKSLQELQDMNNRRHTDNFIPSQKSPIPLNRYDDFEELSPPVKPRPRSPEPRLLARALYNFVGQTARELTFRKGDLIYVRRQVDKNWYEGELNAMVGLFPVNYVEIVTYDTAKTTPRKSHEGQARAKYNFVAQTHLELSLAKGELVVITRRVDDNWFEGKIGGRKGIFPVSYVDVLIDASDPPPPSSKPVAAPAAHSLLLNGSSGGKESMGSHSYTPSLSSNQLTTSYHAKPVQVTSGGSYGSLNRAKNPVSQALHIETQSEPIPYRAMFKYLPQNDAGFLTVDHG